MKLKTLILFLLAIGIYATYGQGMITPFTPRQKNQDGKSCVNFFLEGGYGFNGFAHAGVKFKFGQPKSEMEKIIKPKRRVQARGSYIKYQMHLSR